MLVCSAFLHLSLYKLLCRKDRKVFAVLTMTVIAVRAILFCCVLGRQGLDLHWQVIWCNGCWSLNWCVMRCEDIGTTMCFSQAIYFMLAVGQMSLLHTWSFLGGERHCVPRVHMVYSLLASNWASLWSVGGPQKWSFWLALLWMWWSCSCVQELCSCVQETDECSAFTKHFFPAVPNQITNTGTTY